MKEILLENPKAGEENAKRLFDEKRTRRWKLVLYFSIAAGIVSALTGLFLGAVSYLGLFGNADSINQAGNLLIIAAFPLMMFAAHALDRINQIKSNSKSRSDFPDFS
jgi:hypothetical protein